MRRKNNSEDDNNDDISVPPEKSKVPKKKSETINEVTEMSDTTIPNNASQNESSKENIELFKTLFSFPDSLDEYRKQPKDTKIYKYFEESHENFKGSEDESRSYTHNNIVYGTSKTAAKSRRCGKKYFSEIISFYYQSYQIGSHLIFFMPKTD